ncbi:hypothetical protein EU546_02740 [Candidatus Thorarchaeota archaeon]|nr:MAG: hypothetical protein EU546_02740 [Candidatus Thorarchaeota archaeon]
MSWPSMIRVLGFGDSLTAGTPGYDPELKGGDEESQYSYWLEKRALEEADLDIRFENRGVPGELAQNMFPRLKRILRGRGNVYDVAIVLGGSNDIGWGYSIAAVVSAILGLWDVCLEEDIPVIACKIPPIAHRYGDIQSTQANINKQLREAAAEREKTVLVDLFGPLGDDQRLLKPEYDSGDGLHLSVAGYRRMGEAIWSQGLKEIKSHLS